MRKGQMSREQAIAATNLEIVDALDSIDCEPTSRVDDQLAQHDIIEWSASISIGNGTTLVAYYYTTAADEAHAEANDWASVDWTVHGYDIE